MSKILFLLAVLCATAQADAMGPPHARTQPGATDRKACARGDGDACNRAGEGYVDAFFSTNGHADDGERAVELFRKACRLGSTAGCTSVGWAQLEGLASGRDFVGAERTLAKTCAADDLSACALLATVYDPHLQHPGVASDPARTVALLRRACDGKVARRGCTSGCGQLAMYAYYGDHAMGIAEDHVEAARLEQRSCDAGCINSCDTMGDRYRDGDGVAQSAASAAAHFRQGCRAGFAPSCAELGKLYLAGAGVRKSRAEALRMFARSCRVSGGQMEICESDPTGAHVRRALAACERGTAKDWRCDELFAAGRFGSIAGIVTRAGKPLAHALVTASATDVRTLTDAKGRFVLAHVPVGPHTVHADRAAAHADVAASAQARVTLQLAP